jgi:hypothetical protein
LPSPPSPAADADAPGVTLSLASSSITTGTSPVLTFEASGTPSGSAIYLYASSDGGQDWQPIGTLSGTDGTVQAPAEPAGDYQYQLVVMAGGTEVATSTPATLTVTSSSGNSGSNCSACTVIQDIAPVLAPVLEPVLAGIGDDIWAVLAAAFGL